MPRKGTFFSHVNPSMSKTGNIFYNKIQSPCLCNERPSRAKATANPVGGKACSPTKGGLLCYIPNTYSIHKVPSLKFAYFQGRLSHHITSPSEKTRPESWPEDYMGKETPVWQLSLSHRCHQT